MKPHHIRIGVLGPRGRMGQWVTRLLLTEYSKKATLLGEVERGGDLYSLLKCDAVIDFASAEACSGLAQAALNSGETTFPAFVVGSTGWTPELRKPIEELARHAPVLQSSNFSTGVLALQRILREAAPLLGKLGYTAVLLDRHHSHKKDAPSGTALLLGRTLQESARELPLSVHSIRAGEIIGDHELTFYGPGDHLVLGHYAQDRSIFARGAIDAALWLHEHRERLAAHPQVWSMETCFKEIFG